MKQLVTIVLVAVAFSVNAQDSLTTRGTVTVHCDPLLDELLEHHRIQNEETGTVDGYRVQLISSANRRDVLELKRTVYEQLPDLVTHLVSHQPYYKLRAGDFLTKLEAYRLLLQIREDYPDAFIVTDQIEVSEL